MFPTKTFTYWTYCNYFNHHKTEIKKKLCRYYVDNRAIDIKKFPTGKYKKHEECQERNLTFGCNPKIILEEI